MLEFLSCRICGGELKEISSESYKCSHCGSSFVKKDEDSYIEKLRSVIGDLKLEHVSAARKNLWDAMHEEYINSETCLNYARELKSLVPDDYYANFAETANEKGEAEISKFLNRSSKSDMETYADAVLDFMIRSMTPGDLTAVCNYIDRAFPKSSFDYTKYLNLYEEEAEKVESGIYELTMPRDVFVAYSSKDIDMVLELSEYLEEQGITCFISMRNLRHGRGAADNYDKALQTAIDNCKTIVFVSSKNSRSLACDALRKEIPYIRKTDTDGAPAEYRTVAYEKIPYRYKKDRVEYLLDDYANTAADKIVKQFFDGVEWCKTIDDVADRVITYLTAMPEADDTPHGGNIGDEDLQKIISAVTGAGRPETSSVTESVTSIAVKEKNVLDQVKRLISIGDFVEAKEQLEKLERDEQAVWGVCSVSVYYYKILVEHEVNTDDLLIKKIVASGKDLKGDKNFRLARSCDDCPEKTKILDIEDKIESEIKAREQEEKRRREEEERKKKEKDLFLSQFSKGLLFELAGQGYRVKGLGSCKDNIVNILPVYNDVPVTSIGDGAFLNCSSLKSVTIPDSVVSMGNSAFKGCTSLTSIIIPNSVTTIGEWAFRECSSLTSVEIPDSVTSIGEWAFSHCSSLTSISIADSVTSIGRWAFGGCTSLTSLVIPDSVTSIDKFAFSGCSSLKSVIIPSSVKSIGKSAFADCEALTEIIYLGTMSQWEIISIFEDAIDFTKVTIHCKG